MPWAHLTRDERIAIATLLREGVSLRGIGRHLGRSASTISRETRRNRAPVTGAYDGGRAHHRAVGRRRWPRSHPRCDDKALMDQVCAWLAEDYSPDQIASLLPVGSSTIYRYVSTRPSLRPHLRRGRKRRRRCSRATDGRGHITGRVMIDERPAVVNARLRLGDWEGDTFTVKGGWATMVTERVSGYCVCRFIGPRRTAAAVARAISASLESFPASLRKTLTLDNGKEFTDHREIATQLGLTVYFAHPGRPGQRGTCENTIGLMRQYAPKRGRRETVNQPVLTFGQDRLNNRPRKRLGYRTPTDILFSNRCN